MPGATTIPVSITYPVVERIKILGRGHGRVLRGHSRKNLSINGGWLCLPLAPVYPAPPPEPPAVATFDDALTLCPDPRPAGIPPLTKELKSRPDKTNETRTYMNRFPPSPPCESPLWVAPALPPERSTPRLAERKLEGRGMTRRDA